MSGLHQPHEIHPSIRPARAEDQGFVAKGLARQLSDRLCPDALSRSAADRVVDRVLDSRIVSLLVAGDPRNPDRIMGWIAYVPAFTHGRLLIYVYTRDQYRCNGVARALCASAFRGNTGKMLHTFNGPDSKSLLAKFASRHVSFEELIA